MRSVGQAARLGRILRACLSEDHESRQDQLSRLVRGAHQAGLVEAARYHRVVGLAYQALKDVEGVDAETLSKLASFHRQGLLGHLRVTAAVKQVHEALDPVGVPWLVVKGPVLVEVAYRRPGLRLYHDLDLLVAREAFADAIAALEGAGFRLVDRNWDLLRRHMIGELVVSSRHGPEVDVHWDVLYDREIRRLLPIPVNDLFRRAQPVRVGEVSVRRLDPTDTLIHLSMHACKQGGDRLVWLKDIERSIANDPPDWEAVVTRSMEWRVNLFVGAMVARAQAALGAAVPAEILRRLLPNRGWRATLAALDRLFPPQRSTGLGTPATLAVRATRPEVSSTLANAGAGLANRAIRLVRAGGLARDAAQDDPESPASRAFPTGGERGRQLYLEEVTRG